MNPPSPPPPSPYAPAAGDSPAVRARLQLRPSDPDAPSSYPLEPFTHPTFEGTPPDPRPPVPHPIPYLGHRPDVNDTRPMPLARHPDHPRRHHALGAYLFGGGFAVGVHDAGFDVTHQVEDDSYGTRVAKANLPWLEQRWPFAKWPANTAHQSLPLDDAGNSLTYWNFDEPMQLFREGSAAHLGRRPPISFVFCNPPCAVWSVLGRATQSHTLDHASDPRQGCWDRSFSLLDSHRPRVLAVESVRRAWDTPAGRAFMDRWTRYALARGYHVTHWLHDGRHLGLPQQRRRYFLLVHDTPLAHVLHADALARPPVHRTVADVLLTRDLLENPGGTTGLQRNPDGEHHFRTLWHHVRRDPATWAHREAFQEAYYRLGMQVRPIPNFHIHRLPLHRHDTTYVKGYDVWHPTIPRNLGIRECLALCGYPVNYLTQATSPKNASQLIARAVLPTAGRHLANAVARSLDLYVHAPLVDATGATVLPAFDNRTDPELPHQPRVTLLDHLLDKHPAPLALDLTAEYLPGGARAREPEPTLAVATSVPSRPADYAPHGPSRSLDDLLAELEDRSPDPDGADEGHHLVPKSCRSAEIDL